MASISIFFYSAVRSKFKSYNLLDSIKSTAQNASFFTLCGTSGSSVIYINIFITESTGLLSLFWCLSFAVFPVIFLKIITTTLISLIVPRPFIINHNKFNKRDIDTMNVSNELNASCKYIKFEANTFNAISVKNIMRKTLSI